MLYSTNMVSMKAFPTLDLITLLNGNKMTHMLKVPWVPKQILYCKAFYMTLNSDLVEDLDYFWPLAVS